MEPPRFHVPPQELSRTTVSLDRSGLDHLKARRLRPGDLISLFDGGGGEALGRIMALERNGARVEIIDRPGPGPAPALETTLALGVCRWERLRLAAEKATELGATALWPVVTERSRPETKGLTQKLRRAVIESLKQCRRSVGPEILEPMGLEEFWARSAGHDLRLLLDRQGGSLPRPESPTPGRVLILAGPEGGLTGTEQEEALEKGFAPLALSRAVLRVETAVLAALVLVRAHWDGVSGNGKTRPGRG